MENYIIPTKENPTFQAVNDYLGQLDPGGYRYKDTLVSNYLTNTFAIDYTEAINLLHEFISEREWLVNENPKSKWEILMMDGTLDKNGETKRVSVYSITSSKAKKLIQFKNPDND